MPEIARGDAVEAAQRLHTAIEEIVEVFSRHKVSVGRLLQVLGTDLPLTQILESVDFKTERETIANAIDHFEAARKESRIAAWRLLVAEGCSIGQIARMFALSRQLVSRQLKEAGITVTESDQDSPATSPATAS
jgi:hypothetical protein